MCAILLLSLVTFSLQCVLFVHNNTTTICGKNDEEIGVHTLIGDTHIYVEIVPSHALLQSRINVNLMVFATTPHLLCDQNINTNIVDVWRANRDNNMATTVHHWSLYLRKQDVFAQKSEIDEMRIIAIK